MEPTEQELVLVRHGETEWSKARRHTGRTDLPLTPEGHRAAERLRAILMRWQFARVLTSPLQRARITAEVAGYGRVAQSRDALLEWDYGIFEGKLTSDIREECPGWTVWTHDIPGGESVAQVGARADEVLREVRGVPGHVALFGHAHMLRVLAARWLGLPPDGGRLFMMETAAVSVLGYEREQPVIKRWNEHHPG